MYSSVDLVCNDGVIKVSQANLKRLTEDLGGSIAPARAMKKFIVSAIIQKYPISFVCADACIEMTPAELAELVDNVGGSETVLRNMKRVVIDVLLSGIRKQ